MERKFSCGKSVTDRVGITPIEKRYLAADGRPTWVNLTVSLVQGDDGHPDFLVAVVEDVNARKIAELDAKHDPLTGLLNRRGLMEKLERELGRSSYQSRPMVVAFMDLDGFKKVNDVHGHAEGDRCLQDIASRLQSACRPSDTLGRVGGDEFIVLMPDVQEHDARPVLSRLLLTVAQAGEFGGWPIGLSIGAICLSASALANSAEVINRADQLMYTRKLAVADVYASTARARRVGAGSSGWSFSTDAYFSLRDGRSRISLLVRRSTSETTSTGGGLCSLSTSAVYTSAVYTIDHSRLHEAAPGSRSLRTSSEDMTISNRIPVRLVLDHTTAPLISRLPEYRRITAPLFIGTQQPTDAPACEISISDTRNVRSPTLSSAGRLTVTLGAARRPTSASSIMYSSLQDCTPKARTGRAVPQNRTAFKF